MTVLIGEPFGMTAAWAVPFVTIALTQMAVIATSIYLHRALAHRSLHVHPLADVGFRTALWLTTGQCRQQWVAVHRTARHRRATDRMDARRAQEHIVNVFASSTPRAAEWRWRNGLAAANVSVSWPSRTAWVA